MRSSAPIRKPDAGFSARPSWAAARAGARHEDGESATLSLSQDDVKNAPVKMQEMYYPVVVGRSERLRERVAAAPENFSSWPVSNFRARALRGVHQHQTLSGTHTRRGDFSTAASGEKKSALVKQSKKDPKSGRLAYQEAELSP